MADILPPAYAEVGHEAVPAYTSTSHIASRWHLYNHAAKSFGGKRSFSLVSDPSAVTTNDINRSSEARQYVLTFKDNLQLEVVETLPADKMASISSSKFKPPLLATIHFAIGIPTKTNIVFTDTTRKATLTIDASDLNQMPPELGGPPLDSIRLITMQHTWNSDTPLPICWAAEKNFDVKRDTDAQEDNNSEAAAPEIKKKSNKNKSKVNKNSQGPEAQLNRKRDDLSSNFRLIDDNDNSYASFVNLLLSEPKVAIPPAKPLQPGDSSTKGRVRHCGYIDMHDPSFSGLRSAFGLFEKWSEQEAELLVLLSIVATFEINLRLQGGLEGPVFSKFGIYQKPDAMDMTSRALGVFTRGAGGTVISTIMTGNYPS